MDFFFSDVLLIFNTDNAIEENYLVYRLRKYHAEAFEIKEIYRYEGNTDPADEAIIYGIESADGEKEILVNGYGISSGNAANAIIEKMEIHVEK